MMLQPAEHSAPAIRLHVEPTNPGQFLACCGLLELADHLWKGAEGWFEKHQGVHFCLHPIQTISHATLPLLIKTLARCDLTNTMTTYQHQRRQEIPEKLKKQKNKPSLSEAEKEKLAAEKKELDKLWREKPLLLLEPFHLRLDWFVDKHSGGDAFKTWAGQQSVMDIAQGMKRAIAAKDWNAISPEIYFFERTQSDSLPFYFDSDLGRVGSSRDVGFSLDSLKVSAETRPLLELCAFIGLQRFRPLRIEKENRYQFSLWFQPLAPEVAATAACGLLALSDLQTFEFRLLYRTKYLKSFLPARHIGGNR